MHARAHVVRNMGGVDTPNKSSVWVCHCHSHAHSASARPVLSSCCLSQKLIDGILYYTGKNAIIE